MMFAPRRIRAGLQARFFRPFRAPSFALFYPRLTPWASFLRRFAAMAVGFLRGLDQRAAVLRVSGANFE
jgi:hypothetical protein